MSIIKLANDNDFQKIVLDSKIPVLVVFSAVWCGPCKIYKETLQETLQDLKDLNKDTNIKFTAIDVDDCPETRSTYNIRSIPATMIFQNKELKEEINGAISKATLLQLINKYI